MEHRKLKNGTSLKGKRVDPNVDLTRHKAGRDWGGRGALNLKNAWGKGKR